LDLPPLALIGATRSIISRRLRTHAEQELPALAGDLVTWVESYARKGRRTRWSTGSRALLKADQSRGRPEPRPPEQLPRGRHRLPPGVVARSRRTRLIYATAEVMLAKGYEDATVADIVAAASVSRDVFYEHFTDKQHAFLEAQQYSTQEILDAVAVAYFSAQAWPERVWRGLEMLIGLVSSHPALAHLRLVECYAAGPEAIRRAEEITRAFTLFIEEGYSYGPEAARLPRLVSQAITGAIFEVVQRHAAEGEIESLPRELPRLTYIAIAPFTGAEHAIELVEKIKRMRR
jgi:AcrR family transcriptional regulator